jgi:uncharacterized oxidoreductase
MAASERVILRAEVLEAFLRRVFGAAGSSEREAALIARHLVESNLRGHDSHGVGMVPGYLRNAASGALVLNQRLAVAQESATLLVLDGGLGFGQVMAHDAMAAGIERARAQGHCLVMLRNSHHIGRIGHWAEQCAAAGLVSLHCVNVVSDPAVTPFGGTRARLGTNPIAIGVPRDGAPPVVVDFATSRWAVGKVRVAANTGAPVPPGILLDGEGRPTTDPNDLFGDPHGALLPFGEHKGGGLSLACELLAAALGGGPVQAGPRSNDSIINSMLSILIAPDRIARAAAFGHEVERVLTWVSSETRTGPGAIKLPGEPELATREKRLAEGIPVDRTTWEQIRQAAAGLGLRDEEWPA